MALLCSETGLSSSQTSSPETDSKLPPPMVQALNELGISAEFVADWDCLNPYYWKREGPIYFEQGQRGRGQIAVSYQEKHSLQGEGIILTFSWLREEGRKGWGREGKSIRAVYYPETQNYSLSFSFPPDYRIEISLQAQNGELKIIRTTQRRLRDKNDPSSLTEETIPASEADQIWQKLQQDFSFRLPSTPAALNQALAQLVQRRIPAGEGEIIWPSS